MHSIEMDFKHLDYRSYKVGQLLSKPPPGEEVVITGMAGKFPDSDGVYQFRDNLFNKADLVTEDDRRWKFNNSEMPQRAGKFFGQGNFQYENDNTVMIHRVATTRQILEAFPDRLPGSPPRLWIVCGNKYFQNSNVRGFSGSPVARVLKAAGEE